MRAPVQQELYFPSHGGRRKNAGRPATGRVSHSARPRFVRPAPVHVTLRLAPHVWNLRSGRCFRALRSCFGEARGRFGLRLIHYAVLGNHLHLIVEADGSGALSRGMQGLGIRLARALNRVMRSRGRVFADHYHARLLCSPAELASAIAYALGNAAHHYGGRAGADPFSSLAPRGGEPLSQPRTWLLRIGWRRSKRVPHWIARLI